MCEIMIVKLFIFLKFKNLNYRYSFNRHSKTKGGGVTQSVPTN
jgi:hypothetical protein